LGGTLPSEVWLLLSGWLKMASAASTVGGGTSGMLQQHGVGMVCCQVHVPVVKLASVLLGWAAVGAWCCVWGAWGAGVPYVCCACVHSWGIAGPHFSFCKGGKGVTVVYCKGLQGVVCVVHAMQVCCSCVCCCCTVTGYGRATLVLCRGGQDLPVACMGCRCEVTEGGTVASLQHI
jgi:hypothetical protein